MLKILLLAAVVATASGAGSAPETGAGFELHAESQDCCRYNGAGFHPQHSRNYNGEISKCEAGCRATDTCEFFSHHMKYGGTCVLCSACDLNSDKKGKIYNSYKIKSAAEATVVPQVVSFEIEVVGLTVADVQSSLQTYAQALADTLGIDVARVSLFISTSRRRLVEGNTGVTIVATVTASDTDTATASVVEAAVTAPTFATSVVTELQTAGVTVVLTVDTATITTVLLTVDTCSVQCEFNELIKVTHDTTSEHTHHRCYVDNYDTTSQSCVCECCDSATSDCTSNSNFSA
jgi:hypothetical protein